MQGFVSYAHDDYDDFKLLQKHLKQIELGTGFDFWCDERIDAGYDWDAGILDRIRTSCVFLLLASPNYFAAKYVIGRELPAIRNSQRIDDALLIPVILAPCDWEDLLKVPQSVPIGDKRRVRPIINWEHKEDGFNAVREQVKATLGRKFNLKSVPLIGAGSQPMSQTQKGMAQLRREMRAMNIVAESVAGESRINQPEILDRLRSVASLGKRLAESAAEVPTANLLEHFLALNSIIERHPLADIDPDSNEPIGDRLRARDGLGNIKLSLDKAIGAARLAGFKAPPGKEDDERLKSVPRSKIGTKAIEENVQQLDRVNVSLEALRSAAHEETPFGKLPREMVENLADRVEVQVGLAKLEFANENLIDVGAVRRHVEEIEQLAAAFFETAAAMRRVLARGVQEASSALKRSAGAAAIMVRRLVGRLLGSNSGPPPAGDLIHDAPFAPQLVVVPAGSFLMGSLDGEGDDYERPQRKVTIAGPLAVGRFAVTFDEWDAAYERDGVKHNPSDEGWGRGRRPVINVSWGDATAYVGWLSRETGKSYRLLSEAEWEYCCRAGTATAYSFGDTIDNNQAQFSESKTAEVGSFPPNLWGFYDMHGNVWEWCEDSWHRDYRGNPPTDGSVWPGGDASFRVLRGGSWGGNPRDLRSAYRDRNLSDDRSLLIGFRVARTL
jgi:formylglycine-generating enzyme required for sulfatase activity